jgi:predicted alpha/beta-fold hydrolase
MLPFAPLFRSPHLQTILGHYWPRPDVSLEFPIKRRLIETEPGVKVLVLSQRPHGDPRGEVVLVHGLEGSAEACYMRSLSAAVLRAGFASHRLNIRTCGGTEHLCQTLYHAGLTGDLLAVLREIGREGSAPVLIAGFSLGGNIVLKLAGELADAAAGLIAGVVAVSTPLDLAACSRRIAEPDNRLYQTRFVRRMRDRLYATGRYHQRDLKSLRSVLALDDRITAPSFGFGDAANYYRTQSSIGFLDRIRVPALLIQAKDDTFIPFSIYQTDAVRANPWIRLIVTECGGHLGFLGRAPHRFWLDDAIMEWISDMVVKDHALKSSGV